LYQLWWLAAYLDYRTDRIERTQQQRQRRRTKDMRKPKSIGRIS